MVMRPPLYRDSEMNAISSSTVLFLVQKFFWELKTIPTHTHLQRSTPQICTAKKHWFQIKRSKTTIKTEKTPATEVTGVFKVLLQAFLPKWQLLVFELRLSDDVVGINISRCNKPD
jgi:hypothetical protein